MSYYYLISGLPDLSLGMDTHKLDFEAVFDAIQRNLEPADRLSFKYLLYPNDNRNLLNRIFYDHHGISARPFIYPSVIEEAPLHDYKQSQEVFPPYMRAFLEEEGNQFASMTMRSLEEKLQEKFLSEVNVLNNDFIAGYFRFEQRLRHFTAAYNLSKFEALSDPGMFGEDRVLRQIAEGKGTVPASLPEDPYATGLGEVISTSDPERIEKFLDRVKWDYLDSFKGFFEREQVFGYTLKLLLLLRWQNLNPERGDENLKRLRDQIKKKVRSPKTPVI